MTVHTTMQAVWQPAPGGPELLALRRSARPRPGPGQVLLRVRAAGVNPADWKMGAGVSRYALPPFVPGLDVSGEVVAAGAGVTEFRAGDEVFGCVPTGGYAEYAVAPALALAPKPASLDHTQAAALPVAGLTAFQSLVRAAGLRTGQRVLVHAAAGGVGHFAVQIAKAYGGYVLATARAARHPLLRDLGVDEPIDYTAVDFSTVARDVDVVVDPIAEDYGPRSLRVLRPGGVLLDIRGAGPDRTAVEAAVAESGLRYVRFGFTPSGADLAEIAGLVDRGALRVVVDRVLPLTQAADAWQLSATNRVSGKIVLTPGR